jgi:dihydroneopterin aldolase
MIKKTNLLYTLDELVLSTHVGIHDNERKNPQELVMSAQAELSEKLPSNWMSALIQDYCEKNKPLLLEKMAYDLASHMFENTPFIKALSLTIEKPHALKQATCSYVTIDMTRS